MRCHLIIVGMWKVWIIISSFLIFSEIKKSHHPKQNGKRWQGLNWAVSRWTWGMYFQTHNSPLFLEYVFSKKMCWNAPRSAPHGQRLCDERHFGKTNASWHNVFQLFGEVVRRYTSALSPKHLGASLCKAGYCSSELYLIEAKLMRVEDGFEWTSRLWGWGPGRKRQKWTQRDCR